MFVVSLPGVHRDPLRYPDPLSYRPERWLEGTNPRMDIEAMGQKVWENARARERRFDLIPFGDGPARCLGQDFNMLEVFQVFDLLFRRYEFELEDPKRPVHESRTGISGPCDGELLVRFRRARATH
jgi:cytochrome P450